MKAFVKVTAYLLLSTMLLLSLFSCNSQKPGSTPPAADAVPSLTVGEDYVITCPSDNKEVSKLCRTIKYAFRDEIGITVNVKEDFVPDPSQIPEKEILVGKTDRPESAKAYEKLGEDQWSLTVEGNKIVIAGTTSLALSDAVKYFISTYVKGVSVVKIPANTAYLSATPPIDFKWADGDITTVKTSGGYPRLYALKDGTLLLGCDGMTVYRSTDGGKTWSEGIHTSNRHAGTANAAFIQTDDGTVYMGFRATRHTASGEFYSSIQVCYSTDNGYTWKQHSTVYENTEVTGVYKGVWEPHFGMMNGKLTCFYANDSTNITTYQNIEYKQWDPEAKEWTNRTIVCNGEDHKSRDGMPVWQQLSTGEYVCVIEAFNKDDNNCFAIKLTYSTDGVKWSEPVTVMRAKKSGTVCAAPYIVELPTGQLVISCQTNELENTPNEVFYMATVISDGTPVNLLTEENFTDHDYVFADQTPNASSMWNGMYVWNGSIYACSITPSGVRINRIELDQE